MKLWCNSTMTNIIFLNEKKITNCEFFINKMGEDTSIVELIWVSRVLIGISVTLSVTKAKCISVNPLQTSNFLNEITLCRFVDKNCNPLVHFVTELCLGGSPIHQVAFELSETMAAHRQYRKWTLPVSVQPNSCRWARALPKISVR